MPSPNVAAAGSTKVRTLWEAHLVAAFLRIVSEQHPDITLELLDDSGQFVTCLSAFLRGGRFEINRELLNAQRERVLEASGDPQAGAAFLWAEARALNGEFLTDVPVSDDIMEVPELVLDMDREDYQGATVGELATHFVRRMLTDLVPQPGECQDSCRLNLNLVCGAYELLAWLGLSVTAGAGAQFRVSPLQRSGFRRRAC
jgi:hypothetical protein